MSAPQPARTPQTREEALEELRLVTALARRIYLDLCHSIEDLPLAHPMLTAMKERCRSFGKGLGDTAAYRHDLHETIEKLKLENQALAEENEKLRRKVLALRATR